MPPNMHMKHVRFVVVWQLAPTLEFAASFLGMRPRSVTRQANRMRAAGVPLKSTLTDQRFNPHKETNRDEPLTVEQQGFMAANYDFATRVAWKACRSVDVPPHMVEEFVEDAATEALLLTARRSTEPGFVSETARGLLATVVKRQVWGLLKNRLKPVQACPGFEERTPSRRFPDPVEEAIRREERAMMRHQEEMARAFIGPMPDVSRRKESAETKELLVLRRKARQLGLGTTGTAAELLERLAGCYRDQLSRLSPAGERVEPRRPQVPEAIRLRMEAPPPVGNAQQQEAEAFVRAWETSDSVMGAAKRLGKSVRAVTAFARRLRQLGVTNLRELPASPAPMVRAVLALRPSLN